MIKNKPLLIIITYALLVITLASLNIQGRPSAEQSDIEAAAGFDIEKGIKDLDTYKVTRTVYVFEGEKKKSSKNLTAKGPSFGIVRENRHPLADKKTANGQEKVYLLGEDFAKYGIKGMLDLVFKNPGVNDTTEYAVCKGNASDILNYKMPDYPSVADFIEGEIKSQYGTNFFAESYNGRNVYSKVDSEGRNLVLPYIELSNQGIEITGMALFKSDKMSYKLNMSEAWIMNLLRPEKGKGIFTLQENDREYIDYSAQAIKKIKCIKEGDKYRFLIELNIIGEIVNNTLYKDIHYNLNTQKIFEKSMATYIQNQCEIFTNKMKNEINIDCLELGRVAAAKYGRRTGIDWNRVVCNSDIKINVKVKIDKLGRGNY